MAEIPRLDRQFKWDERGPLTQRLQSFTSTIENRFQPLEAFLPNWEQEVADLQALGLQRVDDTLGVLLEQLQAAVDTGFMVIKAAEQARTLTEEATIQFQATSDGFELFQPTPYLLVVDDDNFENWGMLQVTQWIKETGELSTTCVYSAGAGPGGENWTISCNAAVWPAMRDALADVVVERSTVETLAANVAGQIAVLEGLIDAIEAGPVNSVAGKTGAVTLVIDDVAGLTADLATRATTSAVNTAVGAKQDTNAKLTALANLTWSVNQFPVFTGAATVSALAISTFTQGLLNSADATAWKSALGIVGITPASDSEIRAASGSNPVVASSLASASAFVPLTDAATIALSWTAGINFEVTLTANRVLGNPTGGQPGTSRTVLVKGNLTTDRTLTFGNQYLGLVPVLTTIDDTHWYLLTIFCITSTHFVVQSVRALG